MTIETNATSQTLIATVYNTDGTIKTDLAYNTPGISIAVKRIGQADGSPITLSAKATPATAWASGAFLNLGNGRISVDVANSYFASYTGRVWLSGSFTGGIIVGDEEQVVGYDPTVAAVGANTVTPLDAAGIQTAILDRLLAGNHDTTGTVGKVLQFLDALISSRAVEGDEMALPAATLTALFADADVADLVNQIAAKFDDAGDLPIQTIAAASRDAILDRVLSGNHDTAGTVGLLLQFLDALISSRSSHAAPDLSNLDAAVTSRSSHNATAVRDAILDRVLSGNHDTAGTVGLLLQFLDALISSRAVAGDEMALPAATLTALFADADVADLVNQIAARFDDAGDLPIQTIAAATRDAILDRVLASNHDTAGTVGLLLQFLDALISSRQPSGPVQVGSLTQAALAQFVTDDTGETTPAAGSVVILATGSGGVQVSSFTALALLQLVEDDTGRTTAEAGSVGRIAQGAAGDNTDQLNRIESQTAKINGKTIQVTANVKAGGAIELHHGDDHTVALGNEVNLPVSDPGGSLYALMNAIGAGNLSVSAIRGFNKAKSVNGTVASLSYLDDVLTVTLEFASAETSNAVVGPIYVYDIYKTDTPSRTYVSGTLTLTRDAG